MIAECIPEECLPYVKASGRDVLERIDGDQLRSVVVGVLCGENVRTATEPLTRRRIAILNAALVITIFRACQQMTPSELIQQAHIECLELQKKDPRRIVLMWLLGLTEKQVQNVLRSDKAAWSDYVQLSDKVSEDMAHYSVEQFGSLDWVLGSGGKTANLDWLWIHLLMNAAGTQSLATRGSEKSVYGKLFERLVMGSTFRMLGFEYDANCTGKDMTFWLSERGDKRECDATAIVGDGRGIKVDIGFIGPGNTEISLDKVSRFDRMADIDGRNFEMQTVIIIDRIGAGSRIEQLAESIDGRILQMSHTLWTVSLDAVIKEHVPNYDRKFRNSSTVKDVHNLASQSLPPNQLDQIVELIYK